MRKMLVCLLFCTVICGTVWSLVLLRDRNTLNEQLIRFHVVANSDSVEDQNVKLQVRDAIVRSIEKDLQHLQSKQEAEAYIQASIPKLQQVADDVLRQVGLDCTSVVSYCKEVFPVRFYETFTLPSGVYDTLRVIIGEGQGQNWWCVTFPGLCMGTTEEAFCETAVNSGLDSGLVNTLADKDEYEVRFFLLDKLGELENYFFTLRDCPKE